MKRKKFPVWIDDATFQALVALKRPDGSRMFTWGLEPVDTKDKPRTRKAKKSR